jgi:hypothetical protein
MKSPEKKEIGLDDNQEELNTNKKTISHKIDKKKKIGKVLLNIDGINPQNSIPFEEQETIDFILMDFKGPRELSIFKNMKHLSLIQQNINSIKVKKYTKIKKNYKKFIKNFRFFPIAKIVFLY